MFEAENVKMFSDTSVKDQKGIKVQHYMKTQLSEREEEYAARVAIIAFWKLDEKNELKCYRYFKVANPITRVVRQDQETGGKAKHSIHDMLFVSN